MNPVYNVIILLSFAQLLSITLTESTAYPAFLRLSNRPAPVDDPENVSALSYFFNSPA